MRFLILVFSLSLALFSCKMEPNTVTVSPKKFDKKEYDNQLKSQNEKVTSLTSVDSTKSNDSILSTQNENQPEITDTIHLKIAHGKSKIDTAKSARQKIVFKFDSNTARKMKLKIIPVDSSANIRISQIIDPDNNSDGPFGREVEFEILKKGKQKVVVSESLMQGEPFAGKFTFEVKLLW